MSEEVRPDLADLIYRIEPDEVPLIAASARVGAKQVLNEIARDNPRFAAEQRQHRRQMKAWRRERDRLGCEMARLQGPFFVAMLYPASETASDTAGVMLKVSDYLFDNDAPAGLIRDLLRVGQRVLQP